MTDLRKSSPVDIHRRLEILEDVEAIKKLKYRYFRASDEKNVAAFRKCFAEGKIVIEYDRIGSFDSRDTLADTFSRLACHPHIVEMHHAQNPEIEVLDAEHARGVWALYYQMIDTDAKNITQLGGLYRDEYSKASQDWQILASEFCVRSTRIFDFSSTEGLRLLFAGRQVPASIDSPDSSDTPHSLQAQESPQEVDLS